MNDSLEKNPVPTLTLDLEPETPAAPAAPVLTPDEPAKVLPAEPVLSPEEEKAVQEFIPKIELSNSNLIVQYGSGAQKKIADFSENVLSTVRTKDLGEVGDMLSDLVTELRGFSEEAEDDKKGFLGLFKKAGTQDF